MSASRAKDWTRGFSGAVLVLVLVLAGAAPATVAGAELEGAEQPLAAPLPLGPPTQLRPGAEGEDGARRPDPGRAGSIDQPSRGLRGIQVNPLGEIDPDSIGILDARNGGFGRNMWRGSDQAAIERLLPRLPGSMVSGTMRSLARRLLLTTAAPPKPLRGSRSGAGKLLALRVDRLAALGDIEGLNDLLRVVPQRHDDEPIARARVEGLLLSGESADACGQIRNQLSERRGKPYWRKALVFCQILSDEVDQVMLGVGLMREQGLSDDPAFFSLVDAYAGVEVTQLAVASPLHFAMLDAVGRPIPQDLIDAASPGLLVAVAKSSKAALDQRALACERAVAVGILQPDALARIYEQFSFDPKQLEEPAGAAVEGPGGRALLYQAARRRDNPAARAEVLRGALRNARRDKLYQMAVQVFLPMLSELPTHAELLWFAETAGRALYAAGRYDRAGAWFTLARQEAVINPQAANVVAVLWPYTRLANSPALAWQGDLEAWRAARAEDSDAERERQALLRGAFMALGESDSLSWIDIAAQSSKSTEPPPDAALLYALREASETRRLGETVLLALLILGENGPSRSHPLALNSVLAALKRVGLEPAARALAIEAAVARGI
jgi:tetratricopeptide (TPR) repeat protein